MFQNTSSSLPAIYQPPEANTEQGGWTEEPASQGDQTGVLSWRAGTQGSHRAGLLPQPASPESVPSPQHRHQGALPDGQLGAGLQPSGQ